MVKIEKAYVYILNLEDGSVKESEGTVRDFLDENGFSHHRMLSWNNDTWFSLIDYDEEGNPFDTGWWGTKKKNLFVWLRERNGEKVRKIFDEYIADLTRRLGEERFELTAQMHEYEGLRTNIKAAKIESDID